MLTLQRRFATVLFTLGLPLLALVLLATKNDIASGQAQPSKVLLTIQPGDHISILGNALADRMQHDGWLETYVYSRFPRHNLVFRNLGFGGDELKLRMRSASFGTPDSWLSKTKTDVVFAFFGYNESFAGAECIDKFKLAY